MSAPSEAAEISIDGLTFAGADEKPEAGEATAETVFEYHERDGVIWARYEGGPVRLGFLVGTRDGDKLEFRYSQVNDKGETSNGRCSSTVSVLSDGRVRLDQDWAWESRPGAGRDALEETAVMR
jgi:hypothetical protein